jgi:hypothetical protein
MEQMNPGIINQFLVDIRLRGLSHWTEDRFRWNLNLYAKWCIENGLDPAKGHEEDLLAYPPFLNSLKTEVKSKRIQSRE